MYLILISERSRNILRRLIEILYFISPSLIFISSLTLDYPLFISLSIYYWASIGSIYSVPIIMLGARCWRECWLNWIYLHIFKGFSLSLFCYFSCNGNRNCPFVFLLFSANFFYTVTLSGLPSMTVLMRLLNIKSP